MSAIRRLLIAHFADLAGLSSALNTPVINPEVPLNGIETTKKNTHAQFFQICMSSSYGSFTSLSTGSGQNTCKHLVTQAFNLHSVLTLMTSKCGLDCGTEYESSDCLRPSEFYMGLSPQPRGCSTISGKGWIYPTGPFRMLTSFSFFFRKQSVIHWAIHKRFLTSSWMRKILFFSLNNAKGTWEAAPAKNKSHLKAAQRPWPV